MKIKLNPKTKEKPTWALPCLSSKTLNLSYTIGKLNITKLKQETVGPSRKFPKSHSPLFPDFFFKMYNTIRR